MGNPPGWDAVNNYKHPGSVTVRLTLFWTAGVKVDPAKKLVDVATLPANGEFAPGLQAYFTTSGRPQNQPFAQLLLKNGLQQSDGIETDLGTAIGKLRQIA